MSKITLTDIERAVGAAYNLDSRQLRGKSHAKGYSWPRFVIFHLARVHTSYSLPQLGRIYGGRDHTTVLHGVRRVRELVATDETLAAELAAIETVMQTAPKEIDRLRRYAAQLTGILFPVWPPIDRFAAMLQPDLFAGCAP